MSKDITKKAFRADPQLLPHTDYGGIDGDWNGAGTATASRL